MARKAKTIEVYIKAALRRIWGWHIERKKARARALIAKSPVEMFTCEECDKSPLPRKQVDIDHIQEVDNPQGWDGWDNYINRLFCPAEGLKVLCKPCHKEKTTTNQAIRRQAKKARAGL